MSFLDRYKTDKTLETEGVWVDFGDGVRFKIARLNNKKAREVRERLERPYARMRRVPPDQQEKILTRVLAEAVVLDWEGDVDGKGTKYSVDAAEKLMTEHTDLRDDILVVSNERETFKAEQDEQAEGNSATA